VAKSSSCPEIAGIAGMLLRRASQRIQWRALTFLIRPDSMTFIDKALCAALTSGCMALANPAHAADASTWSQDSKSEMRLIAGSNTGATLRAGIELKLQPGWHTYWRYPGDSGVPPRFDFSGSDNLKTARVRYPAPQLFSDETGNSIGYSDSTIFPVEVVPRDPAKPVTLRLKVDYAVCEKLCIPAEGQAELSLTTGPSARDAELAAAEARVPKEVSAAAAGLSIKRVNDGAEPMVVVDLKAPAGKPVTVFVEGPTPEWALPVPNPRGATAGHGHFDFQLDGLPPGVSPNDNFDLTFTVVEGDHAIEVKTHLD
jgi:DsbC/DsbD-like thiol-disulfide interchange protein